MPRVTRGSSPELIGRRAELERLRDAVRKVRAAGRCVILLSGEAGIGKSRLLLEFERSIRDDPPAGRPVAVLAGGCVDAGGNLAYLPVIELLESARSVGLATNAQAARIRRALDGTVVPAIAADAAASAPESRAATFLGLRELLATAATDREVVVVLDDLHWADRSTLDVIAFLARRLLGTGVLLVLSYRPDDLGRRHPLKPVVADLQRHATLDHIRVDSLDPADVTAQVIGILGFEPEPAKLDRVLRLADGNPFHVEQLLSLDADHGLPPSLREVLDARLDQLDDESRHVVQQAAVIGREVDTLLLAAVAGTNRPDVINGIRKAVDARILVSAGDGRQYTFRHALLRETAYDDLPLIERIEAHRRIAQTLTDHPELGEESPVVATANRARHWLAGHAEPEAFSASLEAARSAYAANAWAEARSGFETALGLWDRIEHPVSIAGALRSEILEQAAAIAWFEGDARRALGFNRRAQGEPDVEADPIRLGRLSHREAFLLDDLGDVAGEGDAARRACGLIPDEPPTIDRAIALSCLGLHALRLGRIREGTKHLERAIHVAGAIGAVSQRAASEAFLAMAWVDLGHVERASEAVLRLDDVLPTISEQVAWSVVTTWTPWIWIGIGEYERGIEYAERLLADARRRGLDRGVGLWCLAPRALAEFWLGRWDDAMTTIGLQGDYTYGIDAAVYLRSVAACIAAARDEPARARALAVEAVEIAHSGFPEQVMVARVAAAWVDLLDDQPGEALAHARAAWAAAPGWEGVVIRSLVLWVGLWAVADLAARPRSRGGAEALQSARETAAVFAAEVDASVRDSPGSAAVSGPRLVLGLAAAEAARIDGRDDHRGWASLAEQLERLGHLPGAAIARRRQAEALLRDRGDRAEAARAIRETLQHAEAMGSARLQDRALAVARAARLDLGPAMRSPSAVAGEPGEPWGLSAREREVLALIVEGRTNRQIGDALFITDKTASAHVTHIMDKLGVSRRTEAALLAIRAGMASGGNRDGQLATPSSGEPQV
jgi:DNA-binding CsgD family transcriptional regulator/tetratricopeptide (TPR) repeat protein